ncbi:MAG: DUF3822 family protein [bacterium]
MSILIRTDGLSFYVPTSSGNVEIKALSTKQVSLEAEIKALKKEYELSDKVKVIIFTDKSVVVPTELYISDNARLYFELKGIDIDFEQDYIVSSQNELCTYFWLCIRQVIDVINANFDEVVYIHILELAQLFGERLSLKFNSNVFLISKEGDMLSLTVFQKNTMVFHEIFEVNSPSDTIFYIKAILVKYAFRNSDNLVVIGENNESLTKILLNFSKTVSEIEYFETI